MRRADREIKDDKYIDEVIRKCHCIRVGFMDEKEVYIVPLNFGYVHDKEKRVFYFHSAKEGRKVELAEKSPYVGFELDCGYELHPGKVACSYSAAFESVIGNGKLQIVESQEEKEKALIEIMYQSTGKRDWNFSKAMTDSVLVCKIEVDKLSCKKHD